VLLGATSETCTLVLLPWEDQSQFGEEAMTDTQVDRTTCCSNGCPMLASMSHGTTGDDWMCFIHVKAAPGTSHIITLELNRMAWLVAIVRRLRAGLTAQDAGEIQQSIAMAQQNHLQRGENEGGVAWMIRLEGVLAASCAAAVAEK